MLRLSAAIVGVVVAALVLSGCGYRPLYAKTGNQPSVSSALSEITMAEQTHRQGQMVRNELISAFGSGSGSGRYLLKLSVRERGMGVSALRGTHVRRFRSQWTVKYALVEATGGKLLTSGESTSAVPFDLIDEPVSDMQAQENAKVRGAREVAQDIRLRLSAYFASVGG